MTKSINFLLTPRIQKLTRSQLLQFYKSRVVHPHRRRNTVSTNPGGFLHNEVCLSRKTYSLISKLFKIGIGIDVKGKNSLELLPISHWASPLVWDENCKQLCLDIPDFSEPSWSDSNKKTESESDFLFQR